MLGWAIVIALSTLFTRQHYFVDVLGGGIVAWVANILAPWTVDSIGIASLHLVLVA